MECYPRRVSQPQRHPLLATGRRYIRLSAVIGGFTALCLGVGGYFAWNGRILITAGMAMPIVAETTKHITKGNFDEAERVADSIPVQSCRSICAIDLLADLALAETDPTMTAEEKERIAAERRAVPEIDASLRTVRGEA